MREIMKGFAGWMTIVKDPQRYVGDKPRMLMSCADFQYLQNQPLLNTGRTYIDKEYDLIYINRGYN